ncbi:hypothetical protein GOP47_0005720 [Adiantum capillus-veneris]|uniref:Uncharacterized protein n=1 Tax=Adiantum capillus-veneris TaxID=13818 RepID=A0A9D4V6K2_ADICA|nr:hypothetical protein GOP47_0005720 [Adiantum capillus-veneris]
MHLSFLTQPFSQKHKLANHFKFVKLAKVENTWDVSTNDIDMISRHISIKRSKTKVAQKPLCKRHNPIVFKWPTTYMTCRTVDVASTYVPHGYLPVCVGGSYDDAKRYLVKAKDLNHPVFLDLLEYTALEYGYSNTGILKIVCDIEHFEKVLASFSHRYPAKPIAQSPKLAPKKATK